MGTNECEPQCNPMAITANELKHRLDSGGPIIVLDMGKKERYERKHIPGSANIVINTESKMNIIPRLPKYIEQLIPKLII